MATDDLLAAADRLLSQGRGRPRLVFIRRAVSSCYYALFHAMARNSADCLFGSTRQARGTADWVRVYRSIDHGTAKSQCEKLSKHTEFPPAIQDFGVLFVELQKHRHRADYDPTSRFSVSEAKLQLAQARLVIAAFRRCPLQVRRSFAVFVTIRSRVG